MKIAAEGQVNRPVASKQASSAPTNWCTIQQFSDQPAKIPPIRQAVIVILKMKKLKYKAKPPAEKMHNYYLPMVESDALYSRQLSKLTQPAFKLPLHKIAKDLNLLLHMDEQQLWVELGSSQSLRVCLQSCLAVLPRRQYAGYQPAALSKRETIQQQAQQYRIYAQLTKATLYLYYRISAAASPAHKQLLYELWLLDIPKLLDIAAIYGESNGQIVREIISRTYEAHASYDEDTLEFLQLVERHRLLAPRADRLVEVDFSPQALKSKHFGNRERFMIQEAMQEMFRVKDLLLNLTNFLTYFPEKYVHELAADYKIQERLIKCLALFLKETAQDWKMGQYEKYFECHFEDIRQSIARYFKLQFEKLRGILQRGQQLLQLAENTYQTLCLHFSNKDQGHKYYRRMVNQLFEATREPVFFLPLHQLHQPHRRAPHALQECMAYEADYRKQKLITHHQPAYDEAHQTYKRTFAKWRDLRSMPKYAQKAIDQDRKKKLYTEGKAGQIAFLKYGCFLKNGCVLRQYDDDYEGSEGFARFDSFQAPREDRQINTNLILGHSKQHKKKNKSKQDLELSVFSDMPSDSDASHLQQDPVSEASFIHTSFTQQLNFNKNKKKRKFTQKKDLELSFENQQSSNFNHPQTFFPKKNKDNNPADLSFQDGNPTPDKSIADLSMFSSKSEDFELNQNQQLRQNEELRQKEEVRSLLAEINSIKFSDMEASFQQDDTPSYRKGEEFQRFTLQDVDTDEFYFNPPGNF